MKNIMKKLSAAMVAMVLIWSCGKDDGPTPPTPEPEPKNSAPVIAVQEFTVEETISDTQTIGTVTATDADKDALTFSIKTNDNALFEITAAGQLSLATGKVLDFETKAQHSITVEVSDGEDSATAEITIKVTKEGTDPQNTAPDIEAQEFTVGEDITDADPIGTVTATDVDGDNLSFNMAANDNNLFEITATGSLSLAAGKSLDFEAATEHSITVSVSDGTDTAEATVTITVTDVDESLASDPASFVTTWKTDANNEEIIIGTNSEYTYNYTIDWGDGTVEQITSSDDATHVYATAGTYTVAIKGDFPHIYMYDDNNDRELKLLSIEQWGEVQWESMYYAFAYCGNMVHNATDVPDLSQVIDMGSMFNGATSFNGNISGWDTSSVTNMSLMFVEATSFNQNIGNWDTSNVTDMSYMFSGATSFNGDLSGWDTSKVTDMSLMFRGAASFNQSLSNWDTSKVTSMFRMFFEATSFDQSIGSWNLSSIENMRNMLDSSGLTKASLRDTLVGWSTFVTDNNGPNGIILGMDGLTSCTEANNAFQNLSNNYGWSYAGTVGFQANCTDF